jgi:ParB-like chromosome segregation protein Spo0J
MSVANHFEPHPLADIFPSFDGGALAELTGDIKTNGLRQPIVLHEGKILDGRNRYAACIAADVEPAIIEYDGTDPLGYVISLNIHRRHLDTSQRAMVAARIAKLKVGDNQHVGNPTPSQGEAADIMNVHRESVNLARKVIDQGTPELVDAVDKGEVTVSAGAQVATLPQDEQRKVIAKGPRAVKQAAKKRRVERWPTKLDDIRARVVEKFSDGRWHSLNDIAYRIGAKESDVVDAILRLDGWHKRSDGKNIEYRSRRNAQREEPSEPDPTPSTIESRTGVAPDAMPQPAVPMPDTKVTELPRVESMTAVSPATTAAVRKADSIANEAIRDAVQGDCFDELEPAITRAIAAWRAENGRVAA